MDLMKEISGITDVKYDCTVKEFTGHVNTLARHFGGFFSEEEVFNALRKLEEDDNSDVSLIRANPGTGYSIDKDFPWCIIRTKKPYNLVSSGYLDVSG